MVQFWGNYAGSYSTTGLSSPQQNGVRFGLSAGLTITGIGFYRPSTTGNVVPSRLLLWRMSDGSKLAEVLTPSDTGTVGWQWSGLPTPIDLVAGEEYAVTGYFVGGYTVAYVASNGPSTVPTPFTKPSFVGRYGTSTSFPDSQSNSLAWAADVTDDTTVEPPGGGGGATPGEVNDALAEWLSATGSVQTHETDGLPWLTKSVLDAFRTAFDTVVGSVTSTASATGTLFQRTNQLLLDTAALLGRIPTTITTGFDQLFSWFGSAGLPAGADTVPTAIQAIRDALDADVGVELLRERLDLSPALTDTTRWTLVGVTNGAGDGQVTDQADLYLLSITAAPSLANHQALGTFVWYPRWGWVAPLVKGYARERQFHDFDVVAITAGGLFMSGLLVHTSPGWEWTVEAYVLDRT